MMQNIDIWVSGGSHDAPYYRFYRDIEGDNELPELVLLLTANTHSTGSTRLLLTHFILPSKIKAQIPLNHSTIWGW